MNKARFLTELKDNLCGLPDVDIQSLLDYYNEMINDLVEDGLSEEDAISQIGTPQEIAKQILTDTPILKLVKQKIAPKRRMSTLEIVLLIVGSPIWLSLLVVAVAVVFAIYVSLWSVVIALWACEAAFWGGALGGAVSTASLFFGGQNIYAALIMLSVTFVLIGIGILFGFVCKALTKYMILFTKRVTLSIKSCFMKRGINNEK